MITSVENPATLGGTPQTMASNNWWEGATAAISDSVDIAARASQGYVQFRTALSNNAAQNRPPGTFGLNPSAAAVPGGTAQQATFSLAGLGLSPMLLAAGALALVLVFALVKK